MEISIRFKEDASGDHLVSLAIEDVSIAKLGNVLATLPETLAESYARTLVPAARDGVDRKDVACSILAHWKNQGTCR